MLIAAMILGIIGGISYFVGGSAGALGWGGDGAPWWVFALMPIGILGAMGAMLVRIRPNLAGYIMLLAAAGALGVGFASFEDYATNYYAPGSIVSLVPTHAFAGSLIYVPVPLLTLIIGGVLALSSGKKSGAED